MNRSPGERVAIVTGASRGIGRAVAQRLASDGHSLVLTARSEEPIQSLAQEIMHNGGYAMPVACDLSDPEGTDALIDAVSSQHKNVALLVNNAGYLPRAQRLERVDDRTWQHTFDINVTAPWRLSRSVKTNLMESGGVIINVTSTAAFYPSIGLGAYCVTKAALTMLTRVLALEWAREGIRVLGVAPGKVDTDMAAPILDYLESNDQPVNPLGRVATAEEIASFIAFMAGQDASYVTGSIFTIDGGEVAATGADLTR